jgi:hypothetical protein
VAVEAEALGRRLLSAQGTPWMSDRFLRMATVFTTWLET